MGRIAAHGLLIIVAMSFGIVTVADGEAEYDYRQCYGSHWWAYDGHGDDLEKRSS